MFGVKVMDNSVFFILCIFLQTMPHFVLCTAIDIEFPMTPQAGCTIDLYMAYLTIDQCMYHYKVVPYFATGFLCNWALTQIYVDTPER